MNAALHFLKERTMMMKQKQPKSVYSIYSGLIFSLAAAWTVTYSIVILSEDVSLILLPLFAILAGEIFLAVTHFRCSSGSLPSIGYFLLALGSLLSMIPSGGSVCRSDILFFAPRLSFCRSDPPVATARFVCGSENDGEKALVPSFRLNIDRLRDRSRVSL